MPVRRLLLLHLAVALIVASCGGDSPAAGDDRSPGGNTTNPAAAATCLAGDPDCQDVGPLPGGSADNPTGDPVTPPGGGVRVGDVLRTAIDGGFAIQGFYFDDGLGPPRLCDALVETYPPQCGGDAIPFDNRAGAELGSLSHADGVTWSDDSLVIVGEVLDGVFVASPPGG